MSKKKSTEILCWKFFISKYDLRNKQMKIALELCELICDLGESATVEMIKTTYQYGHAIMELHSASTTDSKLQEMIDFE